MPSENSRSLSIQVTEQDVCSQISNSSPPSRLQGNVLPVDTPKHTIAYSQQTTTAFNPSNAAIAATSWGFPRVDIFGIAPDKTIWHKYDVGSPVGWEPKPGFENMKGTAFFHPSVISWGQNRLDYFHIGKENAAHHKYWDGTAWVRPIFAFLVRDRG